MVLNSVDKGNLNKTEKVKTKLKSLHHESLYSKSRQVLLIFWSDFKQILVGIF